MDTSRTSIRSLRFYRWLIPVTLSALGIGYTIWESILTDGYSFVSEQAVMGFVLLGIVGPLVAFGTLTWALEGAGSWEQAQQASERQRDHLLALNRIGHAVNQSLELESVLNHAIDQVLDLMRLTSGEIRLINDHHLELRAARGVSDQFIQIERRIPLGQCICGECALRGELMVIENMQVPAFSASACACEDFASIVSVPVRTAERVVGIIHLASKEQRSFDAEDRAMLSAIGYWVGAAVEKAQLHSQLGLMNQQLEARVLNRTRELQSAKEELAQKAQVLSQVLAEEQRVEEKTRAHIAHDLHDSVQQLIVGALYEMQAARDLVDGAAPATKTHILAAQELLQRMASEMRQAIYSLRPLALDSGGLAPVIRECAARFQHVTKLKCDVEFIGNLRRLVPEVEIAAFRIVQETLNNVQAHAQAQRVQIDVRFNISNLSLIIRDDGVGFDLAAMQRETRAHLGLIGMRERAESVGGTLEIWSSPGQGTRVSFSVPTTEQS